jgi:hypothetical protein
MINALVIAGLACVVLLGLLLLWQGPKWQVKQVNGLNRKERFDRENEARKTLATILGGIVLLAGGFFTWRNIILAQTALVVAQEGQITDRFTKAVEQLGAADSSGKKKLEIRLGGVYALERIAGDSERDHWPIIDVLCTYIRENAPVSQQSAAQPQQPPTPPYASDEIQAIITVLGRRDHRYEPVARRLNLRDSNLRKVRLVGNYSLVDFIGADLSASDASGANLSGANLNTTQLVGTQLLYSDLTMASFNNAHLTGADLTGADLSGAYLLAADLSGTDLTAVKLNGAHLRGADLSKVVNLNQAQIDTAEGDLSTKLAEGLKMPKGWK